MKFSKLLFLAVAIISVTSILGSCRTKDDTIAIITVRSASNEPVVNAEVNLYGSGNSGVVTVNDIIKTNSAGEAVFNYNDIYQMGQAGVAVLDISVTKNGSTVQGIIKIEQETTSRETIYL